MHTHIKTIVHIFEQKFLIVFFVYYKNLYSHMTASYDKLAEGISLLEAIWTYLVWMQIWVLFF